MAEHTPGPWTVGFGKEVRVTGGLICKVGGDYYDDGRKDSSGWTRTPTLDTQANARLIAAAPELLAALKYMLANAEAEGWSAMMLSDARAAIHKAEGRSE